MAPCIFITSNRLAMAPRSPKGTINSLHLYYAFFFFFCNMDSFCTAQSQLCRASCGGIPIKYPFGVDDGCGSPYYRSLLTCGSDGILRLRTPSGAYPVQSISYVDSHLLITDPSMHSCNTSSGTPQRSYSSPPFSLDASTRLSLSAKNEFLFFNCSDDAVLIRPKTRFCDRFPDRCSSACDSAAYLCRNLPGCSGEDSRSVSCCGYNPRASESLRLMLRHCSGYTSVYWRSTTAEEGEDQVPEYGIRVDFEIPVTTKCLQCRDKEKSGGTCGYDTKTRRFLCLCDGGNITTYCSDSSGSRHKTSLAVVVGTTTTVSVAGAIGVGALVWYVRRMRTNKVVTCGVQSNENRLF